MPSANEQVAAYLKKHAAGAKTAAAPAPTQPKFRSANDQVADYLKNRGKKSAAPADAKKPAAAAPAARAVGGSASVTPTRMVPGKLCLPNGDAFTAIAHFVQQGLNVSITTTRTAAGEAQLLDAKDKPVASGLLFVLQALAEGTSYALNAEDGAAYAEALQWCGYAAGSIHPVRNSNANDRVNALQPLEERLRHSNYIAGPLPTVADVVICAYVDEVARQLHPTNQHSNCRSVCRWMRTVHNQPGVSPAPIRFCTTNVYGTYQNTH